jgi:hypothetical protein
VALRLLALARALLTSNPVGGGDNFFLLKPVAGSLANLKSFVDEGPSSVGRLEFAGDTLSP